MASLFETLAIGGHRKSDGTPNASGKAWFYKVGTSSPAAIFADTDEHPLSNPVTLSAGGKAAVYFTGQVDVFFEDFLGNPIETLTLSERAERVEVKNPGFTGLLPSGSQGAGGTTDLDAVLSSLYASVGGLDGKYLEYTGATARKVHDVLQGIQVSVKDYGAVGNGVADDTIPVQNAINEVARLGGGVVYFDPGTYSISSALTVTSSSILLCGAGAASVIKNTNGSANALTISGVSDIVVEFLKITHSASSTGFALSLASVSNVTLRSVTIAVGHAKGISITGTSTHTRIADCFVTNTSGTTNIGIYYGTSGQHHTIQGSTIIPAGGGKLVSYDLGTSYCSIDSCFFTQSPQGGVVWETTLTGTDFDITNCPSLGQFAGALSPAFVIGIATIPKIRQANNGLDGSAANVTSGGTVTPEFYSSPDVQFTGTTTGVAYTVNAPTKLPDSTMRNFVVMLTLNNAAGAPITGWNVNAIFKFASAISLVDAQKSTFIMRWDGSAFREIGRGVTT